MKKVRNIRAIVQVGDNTYYSEIYDTPKSVIAARLSMLVELGQPNQLTVETSDKSVRLMMGVIKIREYISNDNLELMQINNIVSQWMSDISKWNETTQYKYVIPKMNNNFYFSP